MDTAETLFNKWSKQDLTEADPNDLAIIYLFVLESGIPGSLEFQHNAERALVTNFADLKRPAIDRLHEDLVTRPILPVLEPNSPLRVTMRLWGKRGEVYKYWEKRQKQGRPFGEALPNRRQGEWAQMPWEFWQKEDEAKTRYWTQTTPEQIAEMDQYKARYRAFYHLPPGSDVQFDPYLDFKIRLCLSTKMRDAGPMGTAFGLAAMMRGGSPEEVMAAIDLGGFADSSAMVMAGGRGAASDQLNAAIGTHPQPNKPVATMYVGSRPPMPLPPVQMSRQLQFANERIRSGPLYRHTFNKGGADDILTNQRLIATPANFVAGGGSAVRAYNGPYAQPFAKGVTGIEFTTTVKPADSRYKYMGGFGSIWPMEEGQYLDIHILNILTPEGTRIPYTGRPKPSPTLSLPPPVQDWYKPVQPPEPGSAPFLTPPTAKPSPTTPPTLVPNQAAAPAPPRPAPTPAPARKLTMREWMVANLLTREWQVVSGIYLQCGIPDNELQQILEMLVVEGYAEKQPDPNQAGWNLYRGTPEWVGFLRK